METTSRPPPSARRLGGPIRHIHRHDPPLVLVPEPDAGGGVSAASKPEAAAEEERREVRPPLVQDMDGLRDHRAAPVHAVARQIGPEVGRPAPASGAPAPRWRRAADRAGGFSRRRRRSRRRTSAAARSGWPARSRDRARKSSRGTPPSGRRRAALPDSGPRTGRRKRQGRSASQGDPGDSPGRRRNSIRGAAPTFGRRTAEVRRGRSSPFPAKRTGPPPDGRGASRRAPEASASPVPGCRPASRIGCPAGVSGNSVMTGSPEAGEGARNEEPGTEPPVSPSRRVWRRAW